MTAYTWHLAARPHSSLVYLVCDDCGYEAVAKAMWSFMEIIEVASTQQTMPDTRHLSCHAEWAADEDLAPTILPTSDAEKVAGERGTANDTLPPASQLAEIARDIVDRADRFQDLIDNWEPGA